MRVITLEEHFWTPNLSKVAEPFMLEASPGGDAIPQASPRMDALLLDLGETRLADMDANGVDIQVIGHSVPAAQRLKGDEAIALAREANDVLAQAVKDHPTRFAGWGTLPTGDVDASIAELERCVNELGFVGAFINSTFGANGAFLDHEQFAPLLAAIERLDVPFYLHPHSPPPDIAERLFGGLAGFNGPQLAHAAFGWHAETAIHTLRLVTSGVFERHPNLRMVIGHGGEMLPFMLRRIDDFTAPGVAGLQKKVSEYLLSNVWITTSGMTDVVPALTSVLAFGVDRVLFSVDYPYTAIADCRAALDALPVSPADKAKIAGGNAAALLRLDDWAGPGGGSPNAARRPSPRRASAGIPPGGLA